MQRQQQQRALIAAQSPRRAKQLSLHLRYRLDGQQQRAYHATTTTTTALNKSYNSLYILGTAHSPRRLGGLPQQQQANLQLRPQQQQANLRYRSFAAEAWEQQQANLQLRPQQQQANHSLQLRYRSFAAEAHTTDGQKMGTSHGIAKKIGMPISGRRIPTRAYRDGHRGQDVSQ